MTTSKDIEKFLLTEMGVDFGNKSLAPDEDLLDQRIIDSMGILKLVVFLEKANDIKVLDEEVLPENFQSINSIMSFIEQKKQQK
jgi:acyl carrier protein